MNPKFNLFSNYSQFNHMHSPRYFDWVKDGTGIINFFVDDYIPKHKEFENDKPNIAMLIEPRTIQPTIYKWVEEHHDEFDIIFTHDDDILLFDNTFEIYFMNWYKSYDVPKTKAISMVCSDKVMCEEHKARQRLADTLGNTVDHYGTYKQSKRSDYYECRAEYMFEVVVDNNWTGYWVSEKLINPLASKTIPIYKGTMKGYLPDWLDKDGIIFVEDINEIPNIVNKILQNPTSEYEKRLIAVENNYDIVLSHPSIQVFEDWLWSEYNGLLEDLVNKNHIS